MAMPALKFESENTVEDRVVILETHIEHIRSDISEMKVDIRKIHERITGVDDKLTGKIDSVDQKLTAEIRAVDQKLTAKIDSVDVKLGKMIDEFKDRLADLALNMEKSLAGIRIGRMVDRVWWLLMSGALLGIMGRAFKWI